jgi:small subunit ribosomal protein S20
MPIIKSAKKRVRQTAKATARNAKTKKGLRHALKNFHAAVTGGSKVAESQSKAHSAIDTAVKKKLMSKNKAARKKSQLAKKAKSAGVKHTTVKKASPAKKTVAKKPAVKKAAAKKTVAKKAPAKKK